MLAGVIDLNNQGETGLLLHNAVKKGYVWNAEDLLRCLLLLPHPVLKVDGKLQQLSSDRTSNDPDLL